MQYYAIGAVCAILLGISPVAVVAGPIADMVCYFEMGQNFAGGRPWMDPSSVLVKDGFGVSLGNWQDGTTNYPSSVTGGYNLNQGYPTGLMMGFSTAVNNGSGNDILVKGNPFYIYNEFDCYYWSEPGYIEVAMETTVPGQTGATVDGWMDETFYMIKPSNYDEVGDPRNGPLSGIYYYYVEEGYQYSVWPDSWGEDLIDAGGSQMDLYGYADWNPSGDRVDISDAIDMDGNYVSLDNIAYVRIRTVTNDPAGIFGSISTEVCYVENVAAPEPAMMTLLAAGGIALLARRRRRA